VFGRAWTDSPLASGHVGTAGVHQGRARSDKIGIGQVLLMEHGKPIFLHMEVLQAHRYVGRGSLKKRRPSCYGSDRVT